MSTLSLRLPSSLHQRLRELAAREGISINQLVTLAAAEKVASILTVDYLEQRASAADLRAFDELLARVPDSPPDPGDELPGPRRRSADAVHEPRARYRTKAPKRAPASRRRKR